MRNLNSCIRGTFVGLFSLGVCALSGPLVGCVGTVEESDGAMEDPLALDDEGENVGAAEDELVAGGEYSWSQGQVATLMGSTNGRACFLTRVNGHFAGGGEYVRVFSYGGSWYLGGGSMQQGVGAKARCIWTSTGYYGEGVWSQGNPPVNLGPTANRTCFLTGVTGHFAGGGEYAVIYPSGGSWYLGGNSMQQGVSASARCVPGMQSGGDYNWSQGQWSQPMQYASNSACFLTRMTGNFDGGGEAIFIYNWDGRWYLGGLSMQQGVGASARCL